MTADHLSLALSALLLGYLLATLAFTVWLARMVARPARRVRIEVGVREYMEYRGEGVRGGYDRFGNIG